MLTTASTAPIAGRLVSTGRMETMEPPESTSGGADDAPGPDRSEPDVSEPDQPEPDEPEPAVDDARARMRPKRRMRPEPAESPSRSRARRRAVVAVVVTIGCRAVARGGARLAGRAGLPGAVGARARQRRRRRSDRPDRGRAADRVRAAARPRTSGFAAAANEALSTVEGATFLLFCHDDVALDPDAVRVMVEEAYRSNAAIVGPKLVDYDHPEVLLEVGMSVDHYGVPFSGIEPGEIDQEQHDGVRDVFFVSHAAMLVRADLFHELGGFDVATSPGSDDIDLCWRARLAGARVLVAPASRVRHRHGDRGRRAPHAPAVARRRRAPRRARRVRVLVKSYSAVALLWVLPSGFVLTLGEAVGLALTRRVAARGRRDRGLVPGGGAALRSSARRAPRRSRCARSTTATSAI